MSNYRLTAAAIMTGIICGGLILYEPPKAAKVERPQNIVKENPVHGFGYVDFEQILLKHSDGEKLKELLGKEIRLKLELNEMMRPVTPPQLPEIDTTPFEESVRTRNMQNLMSQLAAVRAKEKNLADEYAKKTEEEYLKRRNKIRDYYMNEAFNITLKLENAQILHLTQEQIDELQQRLEEITIERNLKQKELLDERTAEITAYAHSQITEDLERIKRETDEFNKKYGEEALQKIRDTQARNQELMKEAMQEIAFRQTRRRELLQELLKTSQERAALEDEIVDSIVYEAGKLGALYKLQMVFIKHETPYFEEKLSRNADINFKLTVKKSPGVMIFEGTDTKDLTADLLKTVR